MNPYIVSSPPNEIQVQHVGDTVKLNCSAGGSPLPKVTWFKNGRSVFSRAAGDGNGLIRSEMVIHRFKPSDSGTYICFFCNGKNMAAESNTSLSMLDFICYGYLIQCFCHLIIQTSFRPFTGKCLLQMQSFYFRAGSPYCQRLVW